MVWSGNKAPTTQKDDPDLVALGQWVEDELERFANEQIDNLQAVDLRPVYNPPLRPREGMVVYADGTKWDPGYGVGPYYYNSANAWVPLFRARMLLLANTTFYVRTDGNDNNTGLVNSAGGAFATWQGAYDKISSRYDFGGNTVTIKAGHATTWTVGLEIQKPWAGGGQLVLEGDVASPGNAIIATTNSRCFFFNGVICPGIVTVQGFRVGATGTNAICLDFSALGTLKFGNLEFGAATVHINVGSNSAASGANVVCIGDYSIGGNATFSHITAARGVMVDVSGNVAARTISFGGGITIGTWIISDMNAVCIINALTWSGSFTGKRYAASRGGIIFVNGAGIGYIPGTVAGTGTNAGVSPFGLYT